MDGYVQLDEISMDILKEIGNVGTGNAVTSLSRMMEQPIELDLPSLKVVKYYKVHELLEQPEELQTGILIEVTGQLKGIFLFMLSEAFTKTVINTILGEEERNLTSLDDMECSLIIYPVPALGGKTPMMLAKKPRFDSLAQRVEVGLVRTVAELSLIHILCRRRQSLHDNFEKLE